MNDRTGKYADERALRLVAEEAAAVFESAAKHNAKQGRTVFAHEQQERANRLRAALAQQATPEAPTERTRLWPQMHDEDGVMRQWYFDCDGHYIDVVRDKDGKFSIFFTDRSDLKQGWLDQADEVASPVAAPEAPASGLPKELPDNVLRYAMECSGQNNPDGARRIRSVYHFIREALATTAATTACAPQYENVTDHNGKATGVRMANADQMPSYAATTASASDLYAALRAMYWSDGKLAVIEAKDLRLGVQTYSGAMLDEAIAQHAGICRTPAPASRIRPDLLDEDGENRAVRTFLMQYSCDRAVTVGAMLAHMDSAGWPGMAPAFALEVRPETHLTKAGAQLWLRHLFSLE